MSKFCPKHGDPKELPHMVDHCTCEKPKSFPINLLGELVAVRFNEEIGTIRLPDWKRSLHGEILATGPGCTQVVPGLQTSFGAAVGMDAQIAGSSIRILKESDLDFVYDDLPDVPKCRFASCSNYVESGEAFCTECLDNHRHIHEA